MDFSNYFGLGNNQQLNDFNMNNGIPGISAIGSMPQYNLPQQSSNFSGIGNQGNLSPNGFVPQGNPGFGNSTPGFFSNADGSTNFSGIASLLQGIGGLYTGFTGASNAKKGLKFAKNAFNKQNEQQVKTYNTNLAGKARVRYGIEGKSQEEADRFVEENKL